ncbi:hypothetical protein BN7_4620 [Wickerhamomyces ciferrii]|uniref:Uncharacterized protein n=1 Tax=Wickerhamomyces ciferrii (strain ATCC 14091 / BCRC 22168 / CBS 111 / JCM 3599 / NBRC 0793 / NRRL Y-1031 F-60-10) TaxID=1206466 RepID=K0KSM1_WICCF|nr:uncharacterized protein BN7_4620 [Wickerhamomyces ciferrii]CCH45042.1 hypothetical protein BN7_4620 [Wickerhamomyces ciferrii]
MSDQEASSGNETNNIQNGLENVYESYLDQINQQNDGKIQEIITEIPTDEKSRLEIQAKTFYFCQQTGNILNIEDYEEWKSNQLNAEPEYSSNYQELVELIIAGKEVPGIKQIPDTVLEGQTSQHVAQERKKPWELKKEQEEKERKEKEEQDNVADEVEENNGTETEKIAEI